MNISEFSAYYSNKKDVEHTWRELWDGGERIFSNIATQFGDTPYGFSDSEPAVGTEPVEDPAGQEVAMDDDKASKHVYTHLQTSTHIYTQTTIHRP